jgi:hypothetical protein
MPPGKPPREVKLTVPDAPTRQEVLELFEQVDQLSRQGKLPMIRGGAPVQPQDESSALVDREWTRTVGQRRGKLTERTMEGEPVRAAWLDRGILKQAAGIVTRNDVGELVIKAFP